MGSNYWKNAYGEEQWKKGDIKEHTIKALLESVFPVTVDFYGLGAGTTDYIDASQQGSNHKKGDADLYIKEYDVFIEVTGPMIKVHETDTLWVRPDKIDNAINKLNNGIGKRHLVIHMANLKSGGCIYRIVNIDMIIKNDIDIGVLRIIHPFIRGRQETYVEIPYDYKQVFPLNQLPLFM